MAIDKKMFDFTTTAEVFKLTANLKFVLRDAKHPKPDLDIKFAYDLCNPVQTFGCQDYNDHRKDTLEELTKLVLSHVYDGCYERGNFYDSNGTLCSTMVVEGYDGGYDGYFLYPSGKTAFGYKAQSKI